MCFKKMNIKIELNSYITNSVATMISTFKWIDIAEMLERKSRKRGDHRRYSEKFQNHTARQFPPWLYIGKLQFTENCQITTIILYPRFYFQHKKTLRATCTA